MFKNSGVNLQQISQTSKKNRINVATAYGFHPTKTFHNSNHHYQEGHLSQLRGKGGLLPFWGKNLHAAYLSAPSTPTSKHKKRESHHTMQLSSSVAGPGIEPGTS